MADSPVLKAIIIDDEPLARQDLRQLLAAHPDIAVAGEAATIASARQLLTSATYDLVFLDVHLHGGTGFDLLPDVFPRARVVFVTAHDQHALRAFEVNALDYLLKPVNTARLASTLQRLRTPAGPDPASSSPFAGSTAPRFQPDDLVHLKLGGLSSRLVPLPKISAVFSCENYSEVQLLDGERHFVRQTMKHWEERLPSTHFMRVHRQAIVNLSHFRGIDYVPEGTSQLHIAGAAEPLPASYRHVPELRSRLAALGQSL